MSQCRVGGRAHLGADLGADAAWDRKRLRGGDDGAALARLDHAVVAADLLDGAEEHVHRWQRRVGRLRITARTG